MSVEKNLQKFTRNVDIDEAYAASNTSFRNKIQLNYQVKLTNLSNWIFI